MMLSNFIYIIYIYNENEIHCAFYSRITKKEKVVVSVVSYILYHNIITI